VSSQLACLAVGVWSVTDGSAGAIKVRVGAIAFATGKGTAIGVLVATPAKFDALSSLAKCSAESRNRQATTRKGAERERRGTIRPDPGGTFDLCGGRNDERLSAGVSVACKMARQLRL
jgi:hypothetical protein